jgi:hypothetical protein
LEEVQINNRDNRHFPCPIRFIIISCLCHDSTIGNIERARPRTLRDHHIFIGDDHKLRVSCDKGKIRMDVTSIMLNLLIPAIVSVVSVFISLKLLPGNMNTQRGDALEKMSQTIVNLNTTMGDLMKDLSDAKATISQQAKQIKQLMDREQLTVKTELHIKLTDPPIITDSRVEYVMQA